MSIIYVASIGTTAATKKYYWTDAKERFRYTESVLICGKNLIEDASRFLDENANLIIIDSPFNGTDGYVEAVEDIARQVMDIIGAYTARGEMIDEVIVNTAGGTEKMSCIIKDAVDVIKQLFPYVTHVWGGTCGYETVYTTKPNIYIDDIKEKILPKRKTDNKPIERPVVKDNKEEVEEVTIVKPKRKRKKKKPKKTILLHPNTIKQQKEAQLRRAKLKEEKKQKKEKIRQQKHKERMEEVKQAQKYKRNNPVKDLWDGFEEWIDSFLPD